MRDPARCPQSIHAWARAAHTVQVLERSRTDLSPPKAARRGPDSAITGHSPRLAVHAAAGNRAMRIAVQRLLAVQRVPVSTDAQVLDAANRGDGAGAVAYLATLPLAAARVTVS